METGGVEMERENEPHAMHHLKVKMIGAVDQKIELENERRRLEVAARRIALHSIMQTNFSFMIIIFLLLLWSSNVVGIDMWCQDNSKFFLRYIQPCWVRWLPITRTNPIEMLDGWKFYDDDLRCLWIMSTGWSTVILRK